MNIVITGAGGVLCSAFSRALAADGHKIALLDLNLEAAEREAEGIRKAGGEAIAVQANVLDKNARSFFDLDQDGVSFVFNLNFLGTLLTTQAFATDMLETGGCIVNISSMNAFTPLTKIPAYSGAKAAVSNFTQWLAVHFANCNIRVNAIAPGFFATNQNRTLLFNEDGSLTPRSHKIISQTPMGRFGEPEELLGTLRFLIDNDASGFVTGITIPVDGGFSAYSGV